MKHIEFRRVTLVFLRDNFAFEADLELNMIDPEYYKIVSEIADHSLTKRQKELDE